MSPKSVYQQIRNYTALSAAIKIRKITTSPASHIHVFGHPRGGSTILAEVIAKSINAPIVWEPFFRRKIPFKKYNYTELWGWKEYIEPDAVNSTIDVYFQALLDEEFLNPRLFTGQSISKIAHSKHLVFKYCYAHNMLHYLTNKFNIHPVILNRHPAQIIASRKNHGGFIKKNVSIVHTNSAQTKNSKALFRTKQHLQDDYIKSNAGVHAWNYCLSQIAIQNITTPKCLVEFDDLVNKPTRTIENISRFLNTPIDSSYLMKNSRTTVGDADNISRQNGWKNVLSSSEIHEIERICNKAFNLNLEF